MTPGDYIRGCREAAEMTIFDLALCVDTRPPVATRRRVELLQDLEAGLVPVGLSTAFALAVIPKLKLDPVVLAGLVDDELKRVQLTPQGSSRVFLAPNP